MIIWFGEENDIKRIVKINWLRSHFNENEMAPLHTLGNTSLRDDRGFIDKMRDKKEKLIISGHGNAGVFMGWTAKNFYDTLIDKGLNHDRFDSVYLLGCKIGLAQQDNSVQTNFLKEFGRLVKTGKSTANNLKVYGPRGIISWKLENKKDDDVNVSYKVVKDVKIVLRDDNGDDKESYSFSAGLLLYSN